MPLTDEAFEIDCVLALVGLSSLGIGELESPALAVDGDVAPQLGEVTAEFFGGGSRAATASSGRLVGGSRWSTQSASFTVSAWATGGSMGSLTAIRAAVETMAGSVVRIMG